MIPIDGCFEDVLQLWSLFFVVNCRLPSDGSHWPAVRTAEYEKKMYFVSYIAMSNALAPLLSNVYNRLLPLHLLFYWAVNKLIDWLMMSVHGNWALWSSWGDCTVTCGAGQRRRFRTCTNPRPRFSGRECVGHAQETQLCNTQNCAGRLYTAHVVQRSPRPLVRWVNTLSRTVFSRIDSWVVSRSGQGSGLGTVGRPRVSDGREVWGAGLPLGLCLWLQGAAKKSNPLSYFENF